MNLKKSLLIWVPLIIIAILILWFIPELECHGLGKTPEEHFKLVNESRKTIAQILGGAFLLFGLFLTYRKIEIAQEVQITERFTRAIDQLGNDKLEISLGGIYALERIAKDSKKDHWTIMEILTNYVRVHAPLIPDENPNKDQSPGETMSDKLEFQTQHPSRDRFCGSDSPPPEVQAILTVIGRRERYYKSGEEKRLNLRETNLRWLKLEGVHLEGASLNFTDLTRATLKGAHLQETDLTKARLEDADLDGAHLEGADLRYAEGLTRGQINRAITDNNTKLPEFSEDG